MLLSSSATLLFLLASSSGTAAADGEVSHHRIRGALDAKGWRSDLPWKELRHKLKDPSSLTHASIDKFLHECVPEFNNYTCQDRTNWALIDQPSGLCMDQLFCAFDDCDPQPNSAEYALGDKLDTIGKLYDADLNMNNMTYSDLSDKYKTWIEDPSNPNINLPGKVLHPRTASDVVAAIKFADEHGLEISVKNSGHSYTSSSTKSDSLLLNMRRYTTYVSDSITDCEDMDDQGLGDDLSGQPCSLSLAKGKSGIIRVSGGENFGDLYMAVRDYNLKQDSFKYHVVGGGAATVSPNGWTFDGGISGTSGGRMFGHGVDQVLQIEMVLPSGHHVKFGPTKWEHVDVLQVPKTLSVSGLCRTNLEETDESKWVWEDCAGAIPFDDLWFDVRGGGGGTWGVVLSMYLQLHDYPGKLYFTNLPGILKFCNEGLTDEQVGSLTQEYSKYYTQFLYDPASLGIDKHDSVGCGTPPGSVSYCYGKNSFQALIGGWEDYVASGGVTERLRDGIGLTSAQIKAVAKCYKVFEFEDYASLGLRIADTGRYPGIPADKPYPTLVTEGMGPNIQVPLKWLLDNYDNDNAPDSFKLSSNSYAAYAGYNANETSDQANSMTSSNRNAAFELTVNGFSDLDDEFFTEIFPEMFDTSDPDNFPGFIGTNHRSPYVRGPLKSDWTKACPWSWSPNERDEKCISLQECMYGTKLLKRLEEIKESIDPSDMFSCNYCVGSDKAKKEKAGSTSSESLVNLKVN